MKIVFFAAKPYDNQSFMQLAGAYPQLELEFWEAELSAKTAAYVTRHRGRLRLRQLRRHCAGAGGPP